ncbi:hypothetical protein DEJ46_34705 [Streptomyces venezuelae]|uniref:Uncharacterized protein n=2 Tax=Streptomyces TaxID=1883 RepID=A0A5P2AZB8_STRVZ|nr:hypothetical protein DEJ46_34705 [Streptomyces venezuelae]
MALYEAQPDYGWEAVDLTRVFGGERQKLQPTLWTCTNGVSLVYPGLSHSIFGPSGCGKSLLVDAVVAQAIQDDKQVLYLDYEDIADNVVGDRLHDTFGLTIDQIVSSLVYMNPEMKPISERARDLFESLAWRGGFDLVVIDGVNTAISSWGGLNSNSTDDVTLWDLEVVRPFTRAGCAVLMVDHIGKDTASGFAIGSQAKRAVLTGCAFQAKNVRPFGKGRKGILDITLADKDRGGEVQRHADERTRLVCRFTLDDTNPEADPLWSLENFSDRDEIPFHVPSDTAEEKRAAVLEFVQNNPGCNSNSISNGVVGKRALIGKVLHELVADGKITREMRPSRSGRIQYAHFVDELILKPITEEEE